MTPKRTAQQNVSREIVDYLRLNQFSRGDKITERQLADSLGLSRSPIRNALQVLEKDKIICKRNSRGYQLATDQSALELMEFSAPPSSVENLYDKITTEQISGRLPQEFIEQDLLDQFNVTRNALVKVLNRMWHEGLIEKRLGRGWTCLPVIASREANLKSYEFRLAIEPAILRSSTFRIDAGRLDLCLETHLKLVDGRLRKLPASKVFEINADFHQMLADFSQNDFFRDAVRRQNQLRLLMEKRAARHHDRMLEACDEHISILQAVKNERLESAANLMNYHLVRASRGFLGLPVDS